MPSVHVVEELILIFNKIKKRPSTPQDVMDKLHRFRTELWAFNWIHSEVVKRAFDSNLADTHVRVLADTSLPLCSAVAIRLVRQQVMDHFRFGEEQKAIDILMKYECPKTDLRLQCNQTIIEVGLGRQISALTGKCTETKHVDVEIVVKISKMCLGLGKATNLVDADATADLITFGEVSDIGAQDIGAEQAMVRTVY